MLVLTRRTNQSIVIGKDIIVTILEIKGDQIRLGIRAPRDVPVYRDELVAALSQAGLDAVPSEEPAEPRSSGPDAAGPPSRVA